MFVFFKQKQNKKKNQVLLYVIIEVLNFFKKCNILYVWSAEQNMLYRDQDPLADPEGSCYPIFKILVGIDRDRDISCII